MFFFLSNRTKKLQKLPQYITDVVDWKPQKLVLPEEAAKVFQNKVFDIVIDFGKWKESRQICDFHTIIERYLFL